MTRRYAVDVDVTIKTKVTVMVDASSPEQAYDKAHDNFDIDDIDTYDVFNEADVEIEVDSIEDVTY